MNTAAMQMLADAYASEGTKVICISIQICKTHNIFTLEFVQV